MQVIPIERDSQASTTEKLVNCLKNFSEQTYHFGSETFKLEEERMQHFLERHHPNFWDGKEKQKQTFFEPKMSINDIAEALEAVLQQNQETLIKKGSQSIYQIKGNHNGVEYVLGVNIGRIGQFYPKMI
jgi:hypothetical protein